MSPNPSSNNFFVISEDDSQLLSHLKQNCNPSKLYSESKKLDFTLDTKYYSASVSCSTFDSLRTLAIWRVSNKETPVQSFCYCMKRSQLVFDLTHIDNITKIFDFDTKFIACYLSSVPQPFATTLSRWATERGFEIVDLEPSEDDIEYSKEINEKYGFNRIVEILEGTEWDKKQAKQPVSALTSMASKMKVKTDDGSSDEIEEFDGVLDAKDKSTFFPKLNKIEAVTDACKNTYIEVLESLMAAESILDYYMKQGMDVYPADGELSQIEKQEISEKKAKLNAKKRAKAKAKLNDADNGNELSDDVGIEIDKDEVVPSASAAIPELPQTGTDSAADPKEIDKNDKPGSDDTYGMVEKCLKTMLNAQGHADDEIGNEIIGELSDLKNELADKPRDYRLAIAEKVSSAVLKRLLQDEEDEEKKEE